MTDLQVKYQTLQEQIRHNLEQEKIGQQQAQASEISSRAAVANANASNTTASAMYAKYQAEIDEIWGKTPMAKASMEEKFSNVIRNIMKAASDFASPISALFSL